jgi:hypothetical protein
MEGNVGEEQDKFRYETEHLNMASIAPDNNKHTIGNAPWWFKVQLCILVASVLAVTIGFIGILVPYEPYKFYGWRDVPSEVCPGEELVTSTVSKVVGGPYTIGEATGFAGVVNSNEVPVDTWDIAADVEPHPKQVQPSRVVRTAPDSRGHYKLTIDIDISGRMFGMVPRYQEVEETSTKAFFVRSEFDARCETTGQGG